MENIEIIIRNVEPSKIEELLKNYITFEERDIISSHFFDQSSNTDLTYHEIDDLNQYCRTRCSADIFLKRISIDIDLKETIILLCCDGDTCDIVLNFSENQFDGQPFDKMVQDFIKLFQRLLAICKNGCGNVVTIGYEPANDDDTKIVEIIGNQIKPFNNPSWETLFAKALLTSVQSIPTHTREADSVKISTTISDSKQTCTQKSCDKHHFSKGKAL